MYLKSLELIGFKSFADKTRLEFEPGMTAIVGPNGCGKSNVSDAIRWVLGEKSAKALRGQKMEDVIFNGTDNRKPLGMAEVSLTLADCEKNLNTDYNEVTITRRVFRSGEGQYMINRSPCRLKDIQRLFMDTGIGTNAYSVLEQGRIDQILSARPDDRRAVFEEASGITKFKADKQEALRKLDHTEANLLRLADIIREVKRQIVSLQRQAGKARRYKEMQKELRGIDIYMTRKKLAELDRRIAKLDTERERMEKQISALRSEAAEYDERIAETRTAIQEAETRVEDEMESVSATRSELDKAREALEVNRERIQEMNQLEARDTQDADLARERLAEHEKALAELNGQYERSAADLQTAEQALAEKTARLKEMENGVDDIGRRLHTMRNESVDIEAHLAGLQNELSELDASERSSLIRRERLSAEHAELQRAAELYGEREADMNGVITDIASRIQHADEQWNRLQTARDEKRREAERLRDERKEKHTERAALLARIDILQKQEEDAEGFPGGARHLLDASCPIPFDRGLLRGALADHLHCEPECRAALEAVLRYWLDAVVIADPKTAAEAVRFVRDHKLGAVRLLAALPSSEAIAHEDGLPGEPLVRHVRFSEDIRPLMSRLLSRVRLVDDLESALPHAVPGTTFVTRDGLILRDGHAAECWSREDTAGNPLTRKQLLEEWRGAADAARDMMNRLEEQAAQLLSGDAESEQAVVEARRALERLQAEASERRGELQAVSKDAQEARRRLDTVAYELQAMQESDESTVSRRESIQHELDRHRERQAELRREIAEQTEVLRTQEQHKSAFASEVTEQRVLYAERKRDHEHLLSRRQSLDSRIRELNETIEERARGIHRYRERVAELEQSARETEMRLSPLADKLEKHTAELEQSRRFRQMKQKELEALESEVRDKRTAMEALQSEHNRMDVERAEQNMRRDNTIERITGDYRITREDMMSEPEPEWGDDGAPDDETIETRIAEIRAKLESMGPVNLIADDEYEALQERFEFLTRQQDDLLAAKQQLLDLIKRINQTTTDMFSKTFEEVNENFQRMFKQLFGGGSAKLVLVNEEDVLESGIEIIARPPGKKLQTISLLSGGERTMTAVALLFALYLVKPSPFCLLDELDAALDDANIGRFVNLLKGFLEQSQFVVITHNRQTIAQAQLLYGVTMETRGVSKIVSVKFRNDKEQSPEEMVAAG